MDNIDEIVDEDGKESRTKRETEPRGISTHADFGLSLILSTSHSVVFGFKDAKDDTVNCENNKLASLKDALA